MIRHEGDEWVLYSSDGSRVLGRYRTKAEALKRERQIQFFARESLSSDLRRLLEALDLSPTLMEALLGDGVLSEEEMRSLRRWVSGSLPVEGLQDAEALRSWLQELLGQRVQTSTVRWEGAFLESVDSYGTVWEICIIREGWSANGRYYPRETLETALPLFEGLPVTIYGWTQDTSGHLPDGVRQIVPEGLAANVVGWTESVYGTVAEDGRYEIRAKFFCVSDRLKEKLYTAWKLRKRDLLGFSIDGAGDVYEGVAEGRRGLIVSNLRRVYETTVVGAPAAGGRLLRLVAAIDREEDSMDTLQRWAQDRGLNWDSPASLCEAVVKSLREQLSDRAVLALALEWVRAGKVEEAAALLEKILEELSAESPEPMMMADEAASESPVSDTPVLEEAKKLLQEARLERCRSFLVSRLATSNLPEVAQARIRKRFSGRIFEDAELEEAIQEARELIASVAPGGQAAVEQTPRVQYGRGNLSKVQRLLAEIDLLFDPSLRDDPNLQENVRTYYREGLRGLPSLKRIWQEWYDDVEMRQRVGPAALIREARGEVLREATTTDLATALGVSMEKAVIKRYRTMDALWRNIATVVPIDNFQTQTRILWGGFGRLPTVSESDSNDYPNLGFPREESTTYSAAKRGGLVVITWEMIVNDDLRLLQELPTKLARAQVNELNYFVFGLAIGASGGSINGDTVYDGFTLYHANHRNTTTNALTYANFLTARKQLRQQFEPGFSCLVNMAGGTGTGAQTITVDNPGSQGLKPGDLVQIEAEVMRVATVPNSTSFTVTAAGRGLLGTTDASHPDNSRVYQLTTPLQLSTIYAVVPEELEGTLMEILNSERVPGSANNDRNFIYDEVQAGRIKPLVVPSAYLMADTNNWYLWGAASDIAFVEVGFLGGREEPDVFYQDAPTTGNVFMRDNYTYKLRGVWGGAVVDYRGAQGNIVA